MIVKDLIKELEQMPQDAEIFAEGEAADKVIYEKSPFGDGGIVRIFKAWNIEFICREDVLKTYFEESSHIAEVEC